MTPALTPGLTPGPVPALSPNTQAILLLTAPLIAGSGPSSSELLTPDEYKRLARHLRDMQRQPADFLATDATDILRACQTVIDEARLQRLLARGFLLSQAVERWQARAIWVLSRADAAYPRRLKARLREDAPAVLYGCGDQGLLESGGAECIDQAAMHGVLDAGGKVMVVLADSLEKASLNREHRNLLLGGRLALISPWDPNARFDAGNALQHKALIHALGERPVA